MGDCGCKKGIQRTDNVHVEPAKPKGIVPNKRINGIVTKMTCPKCSYWMALIMHPATNENMYKCQNSLCNHVITLAKKELL